jgi:2-keto-4-pentenoate hydratase
MPISDPHGGFMSQDLSELAARLAKAADDRTPIAPLSDELAGLDAAAGYAIQALARGQAGPLAGRFVVGAPVPPDGIDLRLTGVVLEHNGEVVATAAGAAVLGHPAAAVAWLARSLAAAGEGLRAGQVVLSGGLTAAVPVRPRDVVVASIDRLGVIELAVT